jgi:hypothetical protein
MGFTIAAFQLTTGELENENVISVRSCRSIVNAYVNNAESTFNDPDGNPATEYFGQRSTFDLHVLDASLSLKGATISGRGSRKNSKR